MLDENFKSLQELGDEIAPSASEEEKTKINSLLDEVRTSLETLKKRTSGEKLNGDVHVGETVDTKGLGKAIHTGLTRDNEDLGVHACYSMESGESDTHVMTMNFRFSDDSDEEQRRIRGSSDESQYGSDSGMGDSLMNTLASECTDGVIKTPTGSPENNIAQRELEVDEMNSSQDTIRCDRSPTNEHDIDGILMEAGSITQRKPGNKCEALAEKLEPHVIDRSAQEENLEEVLPVDVATDNFKRRLEDEVQIDSRIPVDHFAKNTLLLDQDTIENAGSDVIHHGDLTEDNAGLNNIVQNLTSRVTMVGQESDGDSLDYMNLSEANLYNDSQNDPDIAKTMTIPQRDPELNDQEDADSGPFIPVEFLLPERASTKNASPNQQNVIQEHEPSEFRPFEETSNEIPPSEQTSSEDSTEVDFLQKNRVHDIEEELLLRNLALQNVDTNGGLDEGQGLVNGKEYPFVSCAPPPVKTVEEFVEEPEALFQRLVDIEAMLRPPENDEDNLKSALLKHVVSVQRRVKHYKLLIDLPSPIRRYYHIHISYAIALFSYHRSLVVWAVSRHRQ